VDKLVDLFIENKITFKKRTQRKDDNLCLQAILYDSFSI